jgi:hypothetical protein
LTGFARRTPGKVWAQPMKIFGRQAIDKPTWRNW